jgi:hypothetical protein
MREVSRVVAASGDGADASMTSAGAVDLDHPEINFLRRPASVAATDLDRPE